MFKKALQIVLIVLFIIAFDYAMEVDKDNLCKTDATAYDGC